MDVITQAQQRIQQGDVIAYPTEAVFGLGCDPFNQQAVLRLLSLKQRSVDKGLILVAAHPQAFANLTLLNHQAWSDTVSASWSNPQQAISWVLPKTDLCPAWISGEHDSVAVRVSHHPVVKALCGDGVLVSTSANPAGEDSAVSCQQVAKYFGNEVWCLASALGGLTEPSQIWHAITGKRLR